MPLLRILRTTSDSTGKVVEVNDTRMSAERTVQQRSHRAIAR
ncbi:MAG: hypothetical protein ACT4NY_11205 [Pseudonocardiales bacterium]